MTITKSNLASQIVKQETSAAGTLHFFNNMAVAEFNEGIHLDLNSGRKIVHDLLNYFGNTKPFGLISNRINSYSIELIETNEVKSIFPNLVAYGIVSHNEAGRMNAEIESHYCASSNISFDNIYEGMDIVFKRVLKHLPVSIK
ncbi:hypothetical protein [Psychroserpens damuponensis]|uniref:hypothetical protein n=1 Tax=Psychroserpens damuponensis TaxID=943936 RepID=UPI00059009D1|nr:hypothetical protein [Psychroserpens damuponensis]